MINGIGENVIVHEKILAENDIRFYGCAYSKSRSGFKTENIDNIKTSQLDSNRFELDDIDDFTSIKQLLVDLNASDSSDWMTISLKKDGTLLDDFLKSSRMSRFKNAFDDFFETIQFSRINNDNGNRKSIMFLKNGVEIEIDNLSTGEQQIVYRGAYLLRNSKKIHNGCVFVDEPELSMHPRWQKKILSYYKKLFTDENNQFAQMFFATHSEYVVESALSDPDTLVIVLKSSGGVIEAKEIKTPLVLPTITAAEINYAAFNILTKDYHIALYARYQALSSTSKVLDTDTAILNSSYYDASKHYKPSNFKTTNYATLPTFIRNAIDHPDPTKAFSEEELRESITLLENLCR